MKRVVVTGMGCINSIADSIDDFADALKNGVSGVKEISIFDTTGYRTSLAAQVDAQQETFSDNETLRVVQFAVKACQEALDYAQVSQFNASRTGVAFATSLGCIDEIDGYLTAQYEGKETEKECYLNNCSNIGQIICDQYNIYGPVYCVSTACAAGTNSIGIAFDEIRYGRADMMICGGVDPISRVSMNGFNALKSLSATGYVRSFSQERDGLIIGEGAGVLVLEEYEHAIERNANILAEVVGYAISNDAYHMTTPDPKGGGAIRCMQNCMADAGVGAEEIDYVNAHGTGTYYNDMMELKAIENVLGDKKGYLCGNIL